MFKNLRLYTNYTLYYYYLIQNLCFIYLNTYKTILCDKKVSFIFFTFNKIDENNDRIRKCFYIYMDVWEDMEAFNLENDWK